MINFILLYRCCLGGLIMSVLLAVIFVSLFLREFFGWIFVVYGGCGFSLSVDRVLLTLYVFGIYSLRSFCILVALFLCYYQF